MGLGLASKYTIVLLAPACAFYMLWIPQARHWWRRPEPYLAASFALLFFLPVVYWNATHAWASFAFQSARRMNEPWAFSLHMIVGLLLFFLMPVGVVGFLRLFKRDEELPDTLTHNSQRFMQVFTLFPLLFFSVFSLTHPVKFNWIGPSLLGVIPWLAWLQAEKVARHWLQTLALLLLIYSGVIAVISYGATFYLPDAVMRSVLTKFIDWEEVTKRVVSIAEDVEKSTHARPVLVPLDRYNIASELAFYQAKLQAYGALSAPYAVSGSHVFGDESLMYRYWAPVSALNGKRLVLIADNKRLLDNPLIKQSTDSQTPVYSFWTHSQGSAKPIKLFYYQVVRFAD